MRELYGATTLALGLVALSGVVSAQQAAGPPPCSAPEYSQFDFWVGEWDVKQPDGTPAGHNVITKILNGCVLHESWTAAGGSHAGQSFNVYDARTRRWHQSWVDNAGLLLQIDGGLEDGRMVMRAEGQGRDGKPVKSEITWTPQKDGSVTQHWRMSRDGGDWQDAFLGIYTKVK